MPFDNLTSEPTLGASVDSAVREALQNRLGLRPAGESQADAVVRGSVTRYDPDVPVAYTRTTGSPVDVTSRLVQITVSVEILDQKKGRTLWERRGLLLQGDYAPGQEASGRRKAVDKLVTNIVDGAQSQW